VVKKLLDVSQESARKWLEGEAIPREEKLIEICKRYPCRKEWLQNGEGLMISDPETDQMLAIWAKLSPESRKAILGIAQGAATLAQQG